MVDNKIVAILLITIIYIFGNQGETGSETDYSDLVDSSVVLRGQDKYQLSSSLTSEYARVFKDPSNERKDLGAITLDEGEVSTNPGVDYRVYFFFNSTSSSNMYYTDIVDYTAPLQDAVDDLTGEGCEIDTSPIFASYDSDGRTQSSSANAQSLSTGQSRDIRIMVKAHSNKCYGMPGTNKDNVVCLLYNSSALSVSSSYKSAGTPSSIGSSTYSIGKSSQCFEFPLLSDVGYTDIPITLTGDSSNEPTTAHNITVMSDDLAFDLNAETLSEIYGYVDEDGNQLGADASYLGLIYIS